MEETGYFSVTDNSLYIRIKGYFIAEVIVFTSYDRTAGYVGEFEPQTYSMQRENHNL